MIDAFDLVLIVDTREPKEEMLAPIEKHAVIARNKLRG